MRSSLPEADSHSDRVARLPPFRWPLYPTTRYRLLAHIVSSSPLQVPVRQNIPCQNGPFHVFIIERAFPSLINLPRNRSHRRKPAYHPIRRSNHGRPLVLLWRNLGAESKIGQFHWSVHTQQNVIGFDIAMYNATTMQKFQSLQYLEEKDY